ncbi:MAG: HAD family phosphatase [Aerococcus sp.]|nr:HAD family phosphatase [Aerococcus sp.]
MTKTTMISNQEGVTNRTFQSAIFDLDGTLINSEPIYAKGWRYALKQYGYTISNQTLERMTGQSIQTNNALIGEIVGNEALIPRVRQLREDYYDQALEQGEIQLLPGAQAFLQQLFDEGVTLAIASASKRTKVVKTLTVLEIKSFFTVVVAGDEVLTSKPDPAIYQQTLAKLHQTPATAIGFEDSLSGVLSCTRAGIPTVIMGERAQAIIPQLNQTEQSLILGQYTDFTNLLS